MAAAPGFSLTQLGYFTAVADAGSITQAAARLLIAQSAISVAVTQLEQTLSVQLLIRNHGKGVRLTQAGESFLVYARELLDHASEVGEFGRDLGTSLSGELRLGCFAFIAPFFLPAIVARFRRQHPAVQVSLIEDHLEGVQRSLRSGACDLALLYDVNLSRHLHKEVVKSYPPYVLLPDDHRFAGSGRVSLKDLAHEPLIQVDLPHSRDYLADLAERAGLVLNVAFRTTSFEMVRSLVAHGHGYGVLNQRIDGHSYGGRRVVAVEIEEDLPPTNLVVARVAGARQSRRMAAFETVCRAFFAADQPDR